MKKLTDLTIEITQQCPNHCIFCSSFASVLSKSIISSKDVISVGQQAVELGLERVCISGGEPLLHPEIEEIVNGLSELRLKTAVFTSGICFLNDGSASSYENWNAFKHANPVWIFNVQSTRDETHDYLVGRKGALAHTKKSLISAKQNGFYIEAHIVPNKINLESLEETVHTLSSWGVDKVSFLRLVAQGYARSHVEELNFDSESRTVLESTVRNLAMQGTINGMELRFGIPFSSVLRDSMSCNAGEHKLIIRYDGKVLPCEAFKDSGSEEYVLGDIFNNTLSEMLFTGSNHPCLRQLKDQKDCFESCPAQLLYR